MLCSSEENVSSLDSAHQTKHTHTTLLHHTLHHTHLTTHTTLLHTTHTTHTTHVHHNTLTRGQHGHLYRVLLLATVEGPARDGSLEMATCALDILRAKANNLWRCQVQSLHAPNVIRRSVYCSLSNVLLDLSVAEFRYVLLTGICSEGNTCKDVHVYVRTNIIVLG